MSFALSVSFDDLESALQWVSSAGPYENDALISKETGQIFFTSSTYDSEDELPDDIDDASRYLSVPHKNDLDLGRTLALSFVEERLAQDLFIVKSLFQRSGAYGRFKDLLERKHLLEDWYAFEKQATKQALLAWAKEHEVKVTFPVRHTEA